MTLLARLQQKVSRDRPGLAVTAFWIAVLVAVPTMARMALHPLLGSTLVYATYYPAALIGTLFLGGRAGLLLMFLSAATANYFFVPPQFAMRLQRGEVAGILVFLMADGMIVLAAGLLRSALQRLQAANDREKLLNVELQHRMKNTLAVIQGLVSQTAKREQDPRDFQLALTGRLRALASAHDLLSSGRWEVCELPQLADRALAPFKTSGRVLISGPSCALAPECCVPLVLALHELATNAMKYGALSVKGGLVELSWRFTDDGVVLHWVEQNGPVVTEPKRRGLGSRLLTRQTGLDAVKLQFQPQGVRCDITVGQAKPKAEPRPGASLAGFWRVPQRGGA